MKSEQELKELQKEYKELQKKLAELTEEELENLKLQIKDFSDIKNEREAIRGYYNLLQEFTRKYNMQLFVHTRKFI
mgnify:CR=1 FL=1